MKITESTMRCDGKVRVQENPGFACLSVGVLQVETAESSFEDESTRFLPDWTTFVYGVEK